MPGLFQRCNTTQVPDGPLITRVPLVHSLCAQEVCKMTKRENKSEISAASTVEDRNRHLVLVCGKRDFLRADAVGSDFCPAE